MLGFFRRLVRSRLGVVFAFLLLLLIALAFALGDVTGLSMGGGATSAGSVARAGDSQIAAAELRRRAQGEVEAIRAENPTVDMTRYVGEGGVEATLERLISSAAMEAYGLGQGMVIGKTLVDAQLASFPGLQGPTGRFDQARYESLLAQQRITDAQVRAQIAQQTMVQQLVMPTIGAGQVPAGVAVPYAALLLERRAGQIAFVPASAVARGAAPTDAEIQAWYRRNIARYSLPERRVARYARVAMDALKARSAPTDAEIARTYQADRAKYQPSERRTITQVTILDERAANALAARVKGGAAIAAAARAAGLEPRTVTRVDKAGYAGQSSGAAADAAFAASEGTVIGPVRAAIGFVVARVDKIEQVPGKTLAEARAEIAAALTERKTAEAMSQLQERIGTALDREASFSEIVADLKLTAEATPALTAVGIDPARPDAAPDRTLAPIVNAVFALADGDPPQIVQTAPDGSLALVALDRVVRAAPRPLAEVREAVVRDLEADRARLAARRAASGVVAALNRGTVLPAALAATKLSLPPVRSLDTTRAQLAANPRGAEAPLVLMFSMAAGTAKMLEAPDGKGWYVVKLDRIVPGDPRGQPRVVFATRADIGRVIGREYVQQFTTAVRRDVGVTKNDAAIAEVKAALTGQGGSDSR